MMRTLALVVVAACGTPSQPASIEHLAPGGSRAPPCAARLTGKVIVADMGDEPAIGATLVATIADEERGAEVTITDDDGAFSLGKLGRHDKLTVYYNARQYAGPLPRRCQRVTLEIDDHRKLPFEVEPSFRIRHD